MTNKSAPSPEVILLPDQDGEDTEYEIMRVMRLDERVYTVLMPLDRELWEDGTMVILRSDQEHGRSVYVNIDGTDEFDRVEEAYNQWLQDGGPALQAINSTN